jgi:hypothetical protein
LTTPTVAGTYWTPALTQVPMQTSACTASPNQIVPVSTVSGNVTITLPTGAPAGSIVVVKMVTLGTGNSVTVQAVSGDQFNHAGGGTSLILSVSGQGVILQYSAGIWMVLSDDLPLPQLESLFLPLPSGTPSAGQVPVATGAGQASAWGSGGGGTVLTRATVLTASGNATANTIVPVNTTSGAVTVTLPNAPAAGTRVAVKCIIFGTGNAVTIACAGSDVFNKTGGGTSLTLQAANQGVYLCYDLPTGIWTDLADDLPLEQLDNRYVKRYSVNAYGADPTGTNDSTAAIQAAWTAAINAGSGVPYYPPGNYRQNSTVTANLNGASVTAWMDPGAKVSFYGSGDCLRIYDSSSYTARLGQKAGIDGYGVIDGTNSSVSAASAGLHIGDILGPTVNVSVPNWSNHSGSIGVHFDNQYYWTEQLCGRIYAQNCAAHIVFDCAPGAASTAAGSYDRMSLLVFIDQENAGDGVVFQNGAYVVNGSLGIFGNFSSRSTANSFAVLRITGQTPEEVTQSTYSGILRCRLDIGVECDVDLAYAPQTINVGGAQNGISDCYGLMDFSAGQAFAASNVSSGLFQYFGPVTGDSTLSNQVLPSSEFTVEGPSGATSITAIAGDSSSAAFFQALATANYRGVNGWDLLGNLMWRIGNSGDAGFNIYTNNDAGTGSGVSRALNIGFGQIITLYGQLAMSANKITGLANGSASTDAAAFGQLPSSGSPLALTAGGTGVSESTDAALLAALGAAPLASPALTGTPTAPTPATDDNSTKIATTAFVAGAVSGGALWGQLATTGLTGYAKINGTGNILTWTAPNDGNMHRVLLLINQHVTSGETGGQLQYSSYFPDDTQGNLPFAGGYGVGYGTFTYSSLVYPGTTFVLSQHTALTAGAATVWAELWGS